MGKEILSVIGIVLLITAALCVAPMIFIWAINSLSESGGAEFYINHTAWNYFVSLIFIMLMGAGSRESK